MGKEIGYNILLASHVTIPCKMRLGEKAKSVKAIGAARKFLKKKLTQNHTIHLFRRCVTLLCAATITKSSGSLLGKRILGANPPFMHRKFNQCSAL
jgi:hypothetical protein